MLKKLFAAVLLLSACLNVMAGVEEYTTRIEGTAMGPGKVLEVRDLRYAEMLASPSLWAFNNVKVEGLVELGTDYYLLQQSNTSYAFDVRLKISYQTWSGTAFVSAAPIFTTVHLRYNGAGTTAYDDKSIVRVPGAHHMVVEIQGIKESGFPFMHILSDAALPDMFYADVRIRAERQHKMSLATGPSFIGKRPINLDAGSEPEELEIYWDYFAGAEEYQLEYTWVSDYNGKTVGTGSGTTNDSLTKSQIIFSKRDFELNCTRVVTSNQYYRVPLTYERGYLLYRLRAVSHGTSTSGYYDKRVYSLWSTDALGALNTVNDYVNHRYRIESGHERDKNWQAKATFAEQGKRKDVVGYYDGTLRNRQNVTRINSDQNAIAGETVYDHVGRAAVNFLPVPTGDDAIKFYSAFNLASSGDVYDHTHFDQDAGSCSADVSEAQTSAGAEKYYSNINGMTHSHRDFIAQSLGYPFTVTQYEPDNTGRIRQQSGVGQSFAPGSGHETRYFYSQPHQEQLDRIFGSDVGNAQHYKKNAVVDANGQVSVTYLDMQGRTIATALAGTSSTNLVDLKDTLLVGDLKDLFGSTLNVDLLHKDDPADVDDAADDNHMSTDGMSLTLSKNHFVGTAGVHAFNYHLANDKYTDPCLGDKCYPFVYDVDLAVTNACATEMTGLVAGDRHFTVNDNYMSIDPDNCAGIDEVEVAITASGNDFDGNLDVGTYSLYKKLAVNEAALMYFASRYAEDIADGPCYVSEEDVEVYETNTTLAGTDCDITCEECVTALEAALGTREEYIDSAEDELQEEAFAAEWDALYKDCMAPCQYSSLCEARYGQMLADVSPYGQYGSVHSSAGDFMLSVYNIDNQLPANRATAAPTYEYWRTPVGGFKDELGAPAMVQVIWTGYTYEPAVLSTGALVAQPDGSFLTSPENLATLDAFVSRFQPSWAKALVPYHPEYPYFEWCDEADQSALGEDEDEYTSKDYEHILSTVDTWNEAAAYIIPGGSTPMDLTDISSSYAILENDPFFVSDLSTVEFVYGTSGECIEMDAAALMNARMTNYLTVGGTTLSIEEVAMLNARCGGYYSSSAPPSSCISSPAFGADASTKNAEWQQFKSLYMSLRQEIMETMADYHMVKAFYNDAGDDCTDGLDVDVLTVKAYCGCIGHEDFWLDIHKDPVPVGFANYAKMLNRNWAPSISPWTTGSPVYAGSGTTWSGPFVYGYAQPCTGYMAPHYENKVRRFGIPHQDPDEVSDGGYSIYAATGLCPVAFDLGHLLENMGMTENLKQTNFDLTGTPAFTTLLHTEMGGSTSSFSAYEWDASVSGSDLNIVFDNTTPPVCSTLVLTAPGSLSWANYPANWQVEGMQAMEVTGTNSFIIKLKIDDDNNNSTPAVVMEFTGTTPACLPLDGCVPFAEVCKPNATATDLVALMNALMTGDADADMTLDFYEGSGGIDLSTTVSSVALYHQIFDEHLSWYLPTETGGIDYYWNEVSTGVYQIYDYTTTVPQYIEVLVSGLTMGPQYLFSNPVPTTLAGEFTVDALNISTGITVTCTLNLAYDNGSMGLDIEVGSCQEPQPMACNTVQVSNAMNLLGLLNDLVATSGSVLIDENNSGTNSNVLTGSPHWSSAMQAAIAPGPDAILVTDGTINSSTFVIPITTFDDQDNSEPTYYCTIELGAGLTGIDFTDITNFSNLVADYTGGVTGGYPTQFKVTAHTAGGDFVLTGHSCLALDNCLSEPCTEPSYTCGVEDATLYKRIMGSINNGPWGYSYAYGSLAVHDDDDPVMPAVTNFCDDVVYPCFPQWYALQTAALNALGYYLVDIDLESFCTNGNAACAEAYAYYLQTVYHLYDDTDFYISLPDFCALNVDISCVDAYINYLEGKIAPAGFSTFAQNCAPAVLCAQNPFADFVSMPQTGLEAADPCETYLGNIAAANASAMHSAYINSLVNNFIEQYKQQALREAVETFDMEYAESEYHYTLYYYDQAGNLTRTVPPQGVVVLTPASNLDGDAQPDMEEIKDDRANNTHNYNMPHRYLTTYTYNSLNQLVKQNTPDAGTSYFWYDRLGRLVVSQNAKQAVNDEYSYTVYDHLGRIVQVGQAGNTTPMTSTISRDDSDLETWLGAATKTQVTHTVYDEALALTTAPMGDQENLRNRVVAVFYQEVYTDVNSLDNPTAGTTNYEHATHYSYDVHGNVKTLVQEFARLGTHATGQAFKQMEYDYDLISGKVNGFYYQGQGAKDMWHHQYLYDADNRLTHVLTSTDSVHWDLDAKYFYYPHGPLARVETGHWKVQGTDYAYTVQGWIKGVNSDKLHVNNDMGLDGKADAGNANRYVGADAYGWSLGYYTNDYLSIGSSSFLVDRSSATYLGTYGKDLYNGNISHMITTLPTGTNVDDADPQLGAYTYDQLNRIKRAQYYQEYSFNISGNNNALTSGTYSNKYKEKYLYDGNGNILNLWRWDDSGNPMDNMQYNYYEQVTGLRYGGLDANYYTGDMSNRLANVQDAVSGSTPSTDIESGMSATNYRYDEIGQLTTDVSEKIASIEWTVKNKVRKVIRTASSGKPDLEFMYDAMGNRVAKIVKPDGTSVENGGTDLPDDWEYTYYTLDASGNTIAVYSANDDDSVMLGEQMIYGSERLGTKHRNNVKMDNVAISTSNFAHALGKNEYELKNHLGNVLVTISDMPRPKDDAGSDNITDAFEPTVITASDYGPFGQILANRGYNSGDARFGFNGKENDREMYNNSGASYDFGARIYNSRIGRFLSLDQKAGAYPSLAPYSMAANSPLVIIDPDGNRLFAANKDAQQIVIYSVEPKEAKYIRFNKDGELDQKRFNKGLRKLGNNASQNYKDLAIIVNDSRTVEFLISDSYECMRYTLDNDTKDYIAIGDIVSFPEKQKYSDLQNDWLRKGGKEDYSGKVEDMDYAQFKEYYANMFKDVDYTIEPDSEEGTLGITMIPPPETNTEKIADMAYSTSGNIQIVVSSNALDKTKTEAFAHEAYGHARYYLQGKSNWKHSNTVLPGMPGYNRELEVDVMNSQSRARKNYDAHMNSKSK